MPVVIILFLLAMFIAIRRFSRHYQIERVANAFVFEGQQKGWQAYASLKDGTAIAFHTDKQAIIIGQRGRYKEYSWSAIASVEMLKDGLSVSHTNRGSMLGGALVGGALFGVVGAAVGARSASTRTETKITSVELKVIVDDHAQLIHRVTFFRSQAGKRIAGSIAGSQWPLADHFHALLINAMRTASGALAAAPATAPAIPAPITPAIAPPVVENLEQRLSALWDLKVAGALTDEEFQAQKTKLIAPTSPPA